jgi:hypothetical protein
LTWGSLASRPALVGLGLVAASGSPLDPTDPAFWASFGILGVFFLTLLRRWLIPGYFYEQEVLRRQAAEKLNDSLRAQLAEQTATMNEYNDLLTWLIEVQEAEQKGVGPPRRRPRPRPRATPT